MLERATACLKAGAARDSIRCAAKPIRSRRLLHSTFWVHAAGELDLPPGAIPLLQIPIDPSLSYDDKRGKAARKLRGEAGQVRAAGQTPCDDILLDFLYPQQALALLHRRSAQGLQGWEKRSGPQRPDGGVAPSRGYASKSVKRKRAAREKLLEEETEVEDDVQSSKQSAEDDQAEIKKLGSEEGRQAEGRDDAATATEEAVLESSAATADFADSPLDLAEPTPEAIRRLRGIISRHRSKPDNLKSAQETLEQVWSLYVSIDNAGQDDERLSVELLGWLDLQQTDAADAYLAELYHSIPSSRRTSQVYEVALSMFMRRKQYLSASKLHREALQNLENGYQVSRTLFRHTIDNELWRLAVRTAGRHEEFYRDSAQMRLFWLHVSEIPQLLSKAIKLLSFLEPARKKHGIDIHIQKFCARLFREAVTQEFLQADAALSALPAVGKQQLPTKQIRDLFRRLAQYDDQTGSLFGSTLAALIGAQSRIPYARVHNLVSSLYNMYKSTHKTQPSQHLLLQLLNRVTKHAADLREDNQTRMSLSVASIVRDWIRFHGTLSQAGHVKLVTYYARAGLVENYHAAMERFKQDYPSPRDWKGVLWTSIWMHGRMANLDGAQQAFAAVKREVAEFGEDADLVCWNALLHAHSRADDLEGALTNLQNLMYSARLTPDQYSFHALTELFAKRGDVDGVEDMLEQYDKLTEVPRSTALLGSLLTALIRSDDIQTAEKVLQDTSEKVRKGAISGSLTKCFNIVLRAHAASRDIDSVKRVYRRMMEQKTRLDAETYAALIFALTLRRQTNAAYRVITNAMKETEVAPTAHHYGLVIAGYNNQGLVDKAKRVHRDMTLLNIKPTTRSTSAYLKTQAIEERRNPNRRRGARSEGVALESSLQELHRILQTDEGNDATAEPHAHLPPADSLSDLDLARHFDYLIFVHGKRRCFETVRQLYEQHQELAIERGVDSDAPPIRLLTALMSAYWRARQYDEVEASWEMAKTRAGVEVATTPVPSLGNAGELSAPIFKEPPALDPLELKPVSDGSVEESVMDEAREPPSAAREASHLKRTEPTLLASASKRRALPSPAPGRRLLLSRPLRYYLAALYSQRRFHDLIASVAGLLNQGYRLDNRTFNYFIECLCRASPPLALLAFSLTERFLIPSFPGWVTAEHRYAHVYGLRPQARAEGLEHIRARYLKPGLLMPQYRTLVRLGAVLLQVRRLEAMGRRSRRRVNAQGETVDDPELERYVGTMAQIRKKAPRTLYAVQSMPQRPDRLQSEWLRREG